MRNLLDRALRGALLGTLVGTAAAQWPPETTEPSVGYDWPLDEPEATRPLPSAIVGLRLSGNLTPDLAFVGTVSGVPTLHVVSAMSLHSEYHRPSGIGLGSVTAMAVLCDFDGPQRDVLAVSGSAGLALVRIAAGASPAFSITLVSSHASVTNAKVLAAGNFDGDATADLAALHSDGTSVSIVYDATGSPSTVISGQSDLVDLSPVQWTAGGIEEIAVLANGTSNDGFCVFPGSGGAPLVVCPYTPFWTHAFLERVRSGSVEFLAIALSQALAGQHLSKLQVYSGAGGGTAVWVSDPGIHLGGPVRGLTSGRCIWDPTAPSVDYSDLIVSYADAVERPDVLVNRMRYGGASSPFDIFAPACITTVVPDNHVIAAGSGYAFVDNDGDGSGEFIFGTLCETYHMLGAMDHPPPSEVLPLEIISAETTYSPGYVTLDIVVRTPGNFSAGNPGADQLEIVAWREIVQPTNSEWVALHSRVPAGSALAELPANNSLGSISLTVPRGLDGDLAFFAAIRPVKLGASTPEHAYGNRLFAIYPDSYTTVLDAPVAAAVTEMLASASGPGIACVDNPIMGGIPIIIRPIIRPNPPRPLPPPPIGGGN